MHQRLVDRTDCRDVVAFEREIDARLADPALYTGPQAGEVPALNKRQAELAERIEEAELRWLELHEALEAIPAD